MSSLEARIAKLEKAVAPEESDMCVSVSISPRSGSHLLTDGDASSTKNRPARKRRAGGHVCGPRCVSVSINFNPPVSEGTRGDSAAPVLALPAPANAAAPGNGNASTEPGRGDAQPGQERAAVGRGTDAQPDPPRSPAPAADVLLGLGEAVQEPPAREQMVEVQRARVSVPVGGPTPQLGPEDAVGGPDPHGSCGLPFCKHPLQSHRCWTERLPCRYCGWPVQDHDGIEPGLAYASRRLWPCGTYLAIRFDGGEHDACTVEGCGCPGWRSRAPYISEHDARVQALLDEKDRIIAENAATLARMQTEYEARERDLLRAERRSRGEREHNTPSGAPVFVEGGSV